MACGTVWRVDSENDEVRVSVEGQSVEAAVVSETTPCGEATTE
ncbi:hypothetical protein [Haloprofundus halophilus]|nr:hypothetical protein [Haloprofundus halophilus]